MPLGTREVLVAIRARDVTSRVLREIGTNFGHLTGQARAASMSMFNTGAALTAVGVGMGAVGAAGLKFFNDSVNSFIEYSRQAALTRTQVDELGVSVSQIAAIGKRVAGQIPAPFNEMQDALFDIFSSLDVNVMEAEGLLTIFAKGAVAGQTDIRTAARSTISVMNAYKLPFTDANKVMDIMFEMVRKGVGTYEEFNVAIGRAIPAAVSASQEFDTLAAVMAFLTRQGLSTQMAATSAARAMELFTKPDVVAALRDIGVEVTDAQGNFRQLNEIVLELANSEGWAKMGAADRKKMFQDIFGTGTIQARRFFDTAIPNFRDLNTLTDITSSSSGELGKAYDTMFAQPAMQAQLLTNKYEILRVEIGEKLLPAKIKLIEVASKIIDWWNGLSDSTRTLAIRIAAGTAAFLAIGGAIITVIGGFIMLSAILGPVGLGVASLLGIMSGIAGAIGVAVLAFKAFGGGIKGVIAAISSFVLAFIAIGAAWGAVSAALSGAAGAFAGLGVMSGAAATAIAAVSGAALTLSPAVLIIGAIAAAALAAVVIWKNWDTIKDVIGSVVDRIKDAWEWFTNLSLAGKLLIGVVTALVAPFVLVIAAVVAIVKNFSTIVDAAKGVWEWFNNLHMAGKILIGIITAIAAPFLVLIGIAVAIVKNWSTVVGWAGNLVEAAKDLFRWFSNLGIVFKIIVGLILGLISPFSLVVGVVIGLGMAIVKNWNTIKDVTIAVWSVVVDAVDAAWAMFKDFWNWLTNIDVDVWGTIKDSAVTAWNTITTVVTAAVDFIVDRWNNLISIGSTIWNAVSSAVSTAASAMLSALQTVWGWLNIAYNWFVDNFGDNFAEIWNTISKEVGDVLEELGETLKVIIDVHKDFVDNVGKGASALWQRIQMAWDNITAGAHGLWKAIQFAWDRIKPIFEFFGKQAVARFGPLIAVLAVVLPAVWDALVTAIKEGGAVLLDLLAILAVGFEFAWDLIANITTTTIGIIKSVIEAGVRVVKSIWDNFGDILLTPIKIVWDFIAATFIAGIKVVSNVIQFFLNLIQGDWGEAWQNIVDIFSAMWDHFVAFLKMGIESAIFVFKSLPGAILGFLGDLVGILFDLGKDIITGLIDGMLDLLPEIGEFLLQLLPLTLQLLSDAGTWLVEVGKDLIRGLIDGAEAAIGAVFDWISTTIGNIIQAFKDFFGISSPSTIMLDIGVDIIDGLLNGLVEAWVAVATWFGERAGKVLEFFTDAGTWLLEKGKDLLRGLWNGIKFVWEHSLAGWFMERKDKFLGFFTDVGTWLVEKGKSLLRGLWNGIKWLWENSLHNWFLERKQKFLDFFTDAPGWLVETGKTVLRGLWNGIKSLWDISIAGWFTGSDGGGGISGKFKGFFTNAVNWLSSAGRNIIQGLKNGIKGVVDNMGDWIGDRVDDIIDAFKDFFGISSPSTVMMEVGKNFILGFMKGIVLQAANIPALVSKIGLSAMDLIKHIGGDILGEIGDFFGLDNNVPNSFIVPMMKEMAASVGWTGRQWDALQKLVNAESGFNPNAQNPTSSAYGLFQFLDSTWAGTGVSKTSDPVQQIIAGFRYIQSRYGNPLNAWNFWNSNSPHWYAQGAWELPYTGLIGAHKGEMIIPRTFASELRGVMGGRGGSGAEFNFYGDVVFGGDMSRATSDLDFWTRTQQSGV